MTKALTLFADPIFQRHRQTIDEDLVGIHRRPAHLWYRPNIAIRTVQVGVEQRHSLGWPLAVFFGRGSGQQHDFVRYLCIGCPHFPAVNYVTIVVRLGARLDRSSVQPGVGLGDPETGFTPPLYQVGQPALLLLIAAENHDRMRPENIHMNGRCRTHSAGRTGHRVHHQGRLGHAEPGATVCLRHGDPQPASVRDRLVEIRWKLSRAVTLQPVIIVEHSTDLMH